MDKSKLKDVLSRIKHISLVETNVYCIPERLREIDSSYFVIRNHKRGRFEIHSTDNVGSTYCFSVDELDQRTLNIALETSTSRGDQFIRDMEAHNEKLDKAKDKAYHNDLHDRAKESSWYFKKFVDAENIHQSNYTNHIEG